MKILIAVHGFPPNQIAGAEWQAYRTAKYLLDTGHSVAVVAVDEVGAHESTPLQATNETLDGIPVTRLSYSLSQRWGNVDEYDNRCASEYFQQRFAQDQPDLLHIYSGYRLTGSIIRAAKARGIRVLINLTDFWFLCPRITLTKSTGEVCGVPDDPLECALCLHSEQRRLRLPHQLSNGSSSQILLRTLQSGWLPSSQFARTAGYVAARRERLLADLRLVDCVISNSRFLSDLFVQHGIDPQKVVTLRQGMNRERWVEAPVQQPRSALHVGYIGQIAAHKGVAQLVEAVRGLPFSAEQVKLFIYGDADAAWPAFRKHLLRAIDNDSRIILAGRFANPELPRIHANIDALVVPSLWYENSPNVILESFSLGTPVVASDLGGMAELVQHDKTGRVFPVGDVEALRGELRHIIENRDVLARYAADAPTIPTIDAEMAALNAIYQGLLQPMLQR